MIKPMNFIIMLLYFRYIRALGAMYIRLTFTSIEVYKYLEPLYNDYRKLRIMNNDGSKLEIESFIIITDLSRQKLCLGIHFYRI